MSFVLVVKYSELSKAIEKAWAKNHRVKYLMN